MKKILLIGSLIMLQIAAVIFIFTSVFIPENVSPVQSKVGLILNGSVNDLSWGQSHYEGVKAAANKLGMKFIYEEYVMAGENCVIVIEDMIRQGCNIIICTSFEFGPDIKEMSEKYKNVYFMHATGLEYSKNLISYFGRIYQMRYLSGIVAGLQTKTNQIGYVAAHNIPEVVRGINAFTLGVQKVNPQARVNVVYSGDWCDDILTESATEKLLSKEKHIDVIAMHTDSQRVLEIAEKEGIWSIGYDIDNCELYPNTYLTAPVWNWNVFYEEQFSRVITNKFRGGHYWYDWDSGIFALSKMTENVSSDIFDYVKKEQNRFKNNLLDVFYGPIYDNKGSLKVSAGENISDYVLLNEFDWYVKGVRVYE